MLKLQYDVNSGFVCMTSYRMSSNCKARQLIQLVLKIMIAYEIYQAPVSLNKKTYISEWRLLRNLCFIAHQAELELIIWQRRRRRKKKRQKNERGPWTNAVTGSSAFVINRRGFFLFQRVSGGWFIIRPKGTGQMGLARWPHLCSDLLSIFF